MRLGYAGPGLRERLGAFRTEWEELGVLGRTALIALVFSAFVAVLLGVFIPQQVRTHLIEARVATLSRVADELTRRGLVGDATVGLSGQALNDAVQHELLGGETVRVKVWSSPGVIVYSDVPALVGRTFAPSDEVVAAFAGGVVAQMAALERPENVYERRLGSLFEYYLPVRDASGSVVAVFEVYDRAEPLLAIVQEMQRYVWTSIGVGLGLLSLFVATLIISNARVVHRRRRQAERLLGDLIRAQEDERRRIVGALHDDIAQSLYRLHYGLEDCSARIEPEHPVAPELGRLRSLVKDVESTLRAELRMLHHASVEDLGLVPALEQLAEMTEFESGLDVDIETDNLNTLPEVQQSALFRAAQEAVMNVRKHAAARKASLVLRHDGDFVLLEVEDDGRGVSEPEGLGLATTRERLEAIGGGLDIRSRKGSGTIFRAWVPVA
jgi:signal transduction histidine kinase